MFFLGKNQRDGRSRHIPTRIIIRAEKKNNYNTSPTVSELSENQEDIRHQSPVQRGLPNLKRDKTAWHQSSTI